MGLLEEEPGTEFAHGLVPLVRRLRARSRHLRPGRVGDGAPDPERIAVAFEEPAPARAGVPVPDSVLLGLDLVCHGGEPIVVDVNTGPAL